MVASVSRTPLVSCAGNANTCCAGSLKGVFSCGIFTATAGSAARASRASLQLEEDCKRFAGRLDGCCTVSAGRRLSTGLSIVTEPGVIRAGLATTDSGGNEKGPMRCCNPVGGISVNSILGCLRNVAAGDSGAAICSSSVVEIAGSEGTVLSPRDAVIPGTEAGSTGCGGAFIGESEIPVAACETDEGGRAEGGVGAI